MGIILSGLSERLCAYRTRMKEQNKLNHWQSQLHLLSTQIMNRLQKLGFSALSIKKKRSAVPFLSNSFQITYII